MTCLARLVDLAPDVEQALRISRVDRAQCLEAHLAQGLGESDECDSIRVEAPLKDVRLLCVLVTRLAVLRLLTSRIAMNGAPVSPALNAWKQLAEDPRSVQVEHNPAGHEPRFVSLVPGGDPTPNLWTDAWLAALAMSLDCEIATFDRGFKSFRGLKLRLLTIPAT